VAARRQRLLRPTRPPARAQQRRRSLEIPALACHLQCFNGAETSVRAVPKPSSSASSAAAHASGDSPQARSSGARASSPSKSSPSITCRPQARSRPWRSCASAASRGGLPGGPTAASAASSSDAPSPTDRLTAADSAACCPAAAAAPRRASPRVRIPRSERAMRDCGVWRRLCRPPHGSGGGRRSRRRSPPAAAAAACPPARSPSDRRDGTRKRLGDFLVPSRAVWVPHRRAAAFRARCRNNLFHPRPLFATAARRRADGRRKTGGGTR